MSANDRSASTGTNSTAYEPPAMKDETSGSGSEGSQKETRKEERQEDRAEYKEEEERLKQEYQEEDEEEAEEDHQAPASWYMLTTLIP